MPRNGASQCFHNDISNQLKLFEKCCKFLFFFSSCSLRWSFFQQFVAAVCWNSCISCCSLQTVLFPECTTIPDVQTGNVVVPFPTPSPSFFGPALQSLNFITGTLGAYTEVYSCVCTWGVDGGVRVKDGVPLALYCSQHTHTFILMHMQEKQTNKTSTLTLAALFASVCLLCYVYLSKVQVN